MSGRESCGKIETSQRRSTTSSPDSDEKSDQQDILCCNTKRRQNLKRLSIDIDTPRKRLKINSSPQRPDKIQEAPHSSHNRIIARSPSSDGTKTDFRDTKWTGVRGNPDQGNPKIAREGSPKSAGQAAEKSWPAVAAERDKVRKRKRKRHGKLKDSSGKCAPFPFSQDSHSNKIIKETLESRRKISFKIPVRSCALQKSVEENVFSLDSEKSETKEEKGFLDCSRVSRDLIRCKPEHLFSDSTCKQTVEWEGTFRREPQQRGDSGSGGSVSESFEAVCSSASSGSIEDTDQEMQIVEELHAARVGHMIDLPVAPPAGELMSMDIDLVEDDARSTAGKAEKAVIRFTPPMRTAGLRQANARSLWLHASPSCGQRGSRHLSQHLLTRRTDLEEKLELRAELVLKHRHSTMASQAGQSANTASDRKLLIVVDTNILMNHLKFVRILSTTEIPGFDSLILIIPWVVVQELDRMKEGKLLKHAQAKAVPAVHFIHDSLRSKDRKLWGQSLQLASQRLYGLRDENNDDRVLKCCLQYQELFPCSLVTLCTDDRNLRNKGLISGVKSLSKEELSAELLSLSQNAEVCHQLLIAKQQGSAEATLLEKSSEKEPAASGLSILLESIVSDLEKSLGAALSSILETEMKIAFGTLWMEILYVKPPWTLIHLLRCFKKHWLAVFGLIMEKNLLVTIESIYENLCKANNSMDFTTVRFLLQDSKSLLHAFSTRSDYHGVLPQAFAQVSRLLQTLAEVKTKVKPSSSESTVNGKQEDACLMKSHHQESTVFSGSHVPQPSRHQEIWAILENVWISICQNSTDVFQRLGTNSALSTSSVASLEEAFLYLQKLMAAVKDILEGIQRILAPDSNYQDVETLFNFLIKYEVNKNVRFTVEELRDCLSQTEYREKLAIGHRQLLEMAHTMQQCSASVYMEARHRGWCEGLRAQP